VRTGGAGADAFERVGEVIFHVRNGAARLEFPGRTDTAIVRDFFTQHDIEPSRANFRRFFDAYVFVLDHLLKQRQGCVLPGVPQLLAALAALPEPPVLGLLTGNIRLGAQIKLRHFGLWQHFRTGAFGDDHEDREQLAALALARGSDLLQRPLRGEEVVVIGDTPRDIRCGQAVNALTLAVATGPYEADRLRAHQPTWAVSDLTEIDPVALCNGKG